MESLIIIAVGLTISFAFSELFYHSHYPRIIGHLIGGIMVGVFLSFFMNGVMIDYFRFFSELGIVFLLLLTGLEVNVKKLEKISKDAFIHAIFGSLVPFGLGYLISYYGFPLLFDFEVSRMTAVIIGLAMSITAEATKVSILMATHTLNTKIGNLMVGAGIINDIIGVFFLAVITLNAQTDNLEVILFFPVKFIIFLILCYIIFKVIPNLVNDIQKEESDIASFTTAIIISLFIAALSTSLGLGPVLGAFIAGLMMKILLKSKKEEHHLIKSLKLITMGLIIPFFFIYIGIHIDVISLIENFYLFLTIVVVAITGKILGSIATIPFCRLSLRQAVLVGWGMNSRGAIELVIVQIAFTYGLIDQTIYSALIGMAVISTIIFPFVLKRYINKYPRIMDA